MWGAAMSARMRPDSVRASPFDMRRTSETPRSSSMRRTARPTVDLGTFSLFAAAESEPDSATSTSTPSSSRRARFRNRSRDADVSRSPGTPGYHGSTRFEVLGHPDMLVELADWESAETRNAHMTRRRTRAPSRPWLI